jgi:hypothetical protein
VLSSACRVGHISLIDLCWWYPVRVSARAPTFVVYIFFIFSGVAPCECINNVLKLSYPLPSESLLLHLTFSSRITRKSILLTVWAGIA